MRATLALLLLLGPLSSCRDGTPTAPETSPLPFETLVQASSSGFTRSHQRAVHDPAEWTRVWETLHAGQSPVPARPVVDFGRETVLLAAAGTRSDGCYSIEITAATITSGGAVAAEVTETVPGPGCVCTQALTQPVHVVKFPGVSTRETFADRRIQAAC